MGYLLTELEGYHLSMDRAEDTDTSVNSDLMLIIHALSDLHPQIRESNLWKRNSALTGSFF